MRLLSRLRVSVAVAVGEADEKLVEPKPNLCGHVLEIILFPQQSTNLSEDEFTKEATSVFKRRTDLEALNNEGWVSSKFVTVAVKQKSPSSSKKGQATHCTIEYVLMIL